MNWIGETSLRFYVIWPLPAPLTSSSPLCCVHVGFGAILPMCRHIAASEPLHLPPLLLDLSSPNSCMGHSSASVRSPFKRLSPAETPHRSPVLFIYFFSKHLQPRHIPFICIYLYVICLSHWNASSMRAAFVCCYSPMLRTGA